MVNASYLRGFLDYLRLEKALAETSIKSYEADVKKLLNFVGPQTPAHKIDTQTIRQFIETLHHLGIQNTSQARIISGLRQFFAYLSIEEQILSDPMLPIQMPQISRKLPAVLAFDEIQKMMQCIDRSKKEGERNLALIETLYSCGLRVSELVGLRISDMFFRDELIKVRGKGNKERWVPIDPNTLEQLTFFIEHKRVLLPVTPKGKDYVFLNLRGNPLSRVSVFNLVKDLAAKAGIEKKISPHTFRHSFATHLVENGANLRAVQQMLGHESITTTEIYTHLDKTYLQNTINTFHPRSYK